MPLPRWPLLAGALLALPSLHAADGLRPLFNGRDLTGWTMFMAAPPPETNVPGLKRDAKGTYLEPVGFDRDPLHVFTVEQVDSQPAIHVSGAGFGVISTKESFANFHVRLQVKWGEKSWGYKLTTHAPLDAGLLYFARGPAGVDHLTWPRCLEFQIQVNDFGDLYALGMTEGSATVHITPETAANGRKIKAYTYAPDGVLTTFVSRAPIGNRCRRSVDVEKPHGEWNTLDLYCVGDSSVHVVNGQVVNRIQHARFPGPNGLETLDSGQVCLQTEGGEVFYRQIEVEPIAAFPAGIAAP